jgi:hypothetical protein
MSRSGIGSALGSVALLALAAAVAQRRKPAPGGSGSASKKSSILNQMRNGELQPITEENLESVGRKKFRIKDYARKPDEVKDLIERLGDEIKDESGHYGRSSGRFQFNIKASGAFYSTPDWVSEFLSEGDVYDIVSRYAEDDIHELVREIQDKSSGMYQSWFDGDQGIEGRGGGYLMLGQNLSGELDEISEFEIEGLVRTTPLGIRRIAESDITHELEGFINTIIVGLAQRDRLEAYIRELVREFDSNFDDDFWFDMLVEDGGHDEAEVKAARAASKASGSRARR